MTSTRDLIYSRLKQMAPASALLEWDILFSSLEMSPRDRIFKGDLYFQVGEYRQAITEYTVVLDDEPSLGEAVIKKADALARANSYEELLNFLEVAPDVGDERMYIHKVTALAKTGNHELVENECLVLLKTKVDDEHAFYSILELVLDVVSLARLAEFIRTLPVPHSPNVAVTCSDILLLGGDISSALKRYKDWTALEHTGGHFLPLVRLGLMPNLASRVAIDAIANGESLGQTDFASFLQASAHFARGRWAPIKSIYDAANFDAGSNWRFEAMTAIAEMKVFRFDSALDLFAATVNAGADGSALILDEHLMTINDANNKCRADHRRYVELMKIAEQVTVQRLPKSRTVAHKGATDLFIKTYPGDAKWLDWCLKSVDKFCTGFRQIVIVSDEGHNLSPNTTLHYAYAEVPISRRPSQFSPSGYIMQQVVKLSWTDFTDAETVVMLDSDTIVARPLSPANLHLEGRPIWYNGPWEGSIRWRAGAELLTGQQVVFSHMREHPFILTRSATEGFRTFAEQRFNESLEDLFFDSSVPVPFSEYECFGAYLSLIDDHGYNILTHKRADLVRQYWSWGGLDSDVEKSLEELIS